MTAPPSDPTAALAVPAAAPLPRARRGTGRAVLEDVAKLAGVSTATVSRAFNEPDRVSASVRERVSAAARTLNWIPNAAGRALASTRTHIAGAIIPTLDEQVFASQVSGMQTALAEQGITLFLGCANYSPRQALAQVHAMLGRGVEALAIVGERHPPALYEALDHAGVPYVLTYGYRKDSPHPCIGFDNHAAFVVLTDHLLALGHRRIALLIQPLAYNDRAVARVAGVHAALARQGLEIASGHYVEAAGSIESARASLRTIWQAGAERPTAIICGNDQLALGIMLEAAALGIAIPDDLSVTGFDDVAMARQMHPALTTMAVDTGEIGRRAARYLVDALNGTPTPPGPALLPVLHVRASTGPVPPPHSAGAPVAG
ncbi:MAG: LacI family DNA-binding transcriptional regulator [Janthinobacterium lividum]